MLQRDGFAKPGAVMDDGIPHFAPKAKSVIWLFMQGGVMETFDPKPALNKYGGMTIDETPYFDSKHDKNTVDFFGRGRGSYKKLFPMQVGYGKRGQSGIEVSDWWPHVSECIDDIAVIRSMWTTDNSTSPKPSSTLDGISSRASCRPLGPGFTTGSA